MFERRHWEQNPPGDEAAPLPAALKRQIQDAYLGQFAVPLTPERVAEFKAQFGPKRRSLVVFGPLDYLKEVACYELLVEGDAVEWDFSFSYDLVDALFGRTLEGEEEAKKFSNVRTPFLILLHGPHQTANKLVPECLTHVLYQRRVAERPTLLLVEPSKKPERYNVSREMERFATDVGIPVHKAPGTQLPPESRWEGDARPGFWSPTRPQPVRPATGGTNGNETANGDGLNIADRMI